jgi:hypothetical protein
MNAEQLEATGVEAIEEGALLKAAGHAALGAQYTQIGLRCVIQAERSRRAAIEIEAARAARAVDASEAWRNSE